MAKTKVRTKSRILFLFLFYTLLFFLLIGRIAYLQIVKGEELQKEALEQQTRDRFINSKRGSILDRNGKALAVSATVECVSITPEEVRKNKDISVEEIAKGLSEILEVNYDTVLSKINKKSAYELIKRKVEKDPADKVRNFLQEKKINGVNLDVDTKRFYPYGTLASQVIGFTGIDNQGLEGIELIYDKYLKGVPGRVVSAKDANGVEMPFKYEKYVDAQDGMNVVLTIDQNIQHIAENYLQNAVIENKLQNGAACIIMEPKTGNILAMATYPNYDLNNPFYIQDEETRKKIEALPEAERKKASEVEAKKAWRNKAVVDSYEPGSTFKIFTTAMALEEKVIKLTDHFYCGGSKKVGPHNISCWKHGGHGDQTFPQAIQNSCNPAFIEVGQRVGEEKFIQYFKGFGFTEKTGIELSGETSGIFFQESAFNEVELATSSFGQGFQVTPLQMVSAVSAIANDGKLLKPKIVAKLTDKNNNVIEEYEDKVVRQIVSPETAKTICGLLESVVSEGSGSKSYIKGFRVGGKTGTSEKLPRGNGKYVSSFIGLAPADDPQIVCLVLLDEPSAGGHFGGVIAAPVARNIIGETLDYLKVEPAYTPEERATMEAVVPDVRNKTVDEAKREIESKNFKVKIEGNGDKIVNMMPKQGTKINQQSVVILYTENLETNKMVTVPNVLKQSVQATTAIMAKAGLNAKIVGAGVTGSGCVAVKQTPEAGSQVEYGSIVTVEFEKLEIGD